MLCYTMLYYINYYTILTKLYYTILYYKQPVKQGLVVLTVDAAVVKATHARARHSSISFVMISGCSGE